MDQYDEEISNNSTVETKIINNYNKNINILNKLYYENNIHYLRLKDFLKPFKLQKNSKIKSNVTAPIGRFNIPEDNFNTFFNLLKECCEKEKLVLHFREIQNNESSGIMYDFDLYQDSDKNILLTFSFNQLLHKIFKIIFDMVDINPNYITYASVIIKKKLILNEQKKLYKNGFHILIPGIKLSRLAKKLIYNKILENQPIKELIESGLGNPFNSETFDKGSYSVPTYYLYNCKENASDPYILFKIFKVNYNNENDVFCEDITSSSIFDSVNLIKEFNLNINGDYIKKQYYELRDKYNKELLFEQQNFNNFECEKDEIESIFETERLDADENLEYYKILVTEVLDAKRADDRNLWRNVIYAISNIKPNNPNKFKSIAQLFSMRNPNKWDKNGFEQLWNEAINNKSSNKLSVASLIRWCIIDNKKKFDELSDRDIVNTIKFDVFNSSNRVLNGSLYQYHFAYYIYHLFKQKFVCDKDNNKIKWYEFVLEKEPHIKGEAYKWRLEDEPENLHIYISNRLPDKISEVLKEAEERIKKETNPEYEEYIKNRMNKLRNSAQDLYKNTFKNGIIKEAALLFRQRGFINKLNTDQNIMGVGNGVLELSDNPKLIRYYHDYAISLFTEIDYVPYDKNNKYIKMLLDGIYNLFPEDEKDAFHYIMYYLASCLDGKPKDSMILIITGCGCHAIDTPILMYNKKIKKVQDIMVGDIVMGDDYLPRIVQKLYRGQDYMVEIIPDNNSPFIVNINHILSLTVLNTYIIYTDFDIKQYYYIYWYTYSNNKINQHYFKTYDYSEIIYFKNNLLKKKNIILNYDIVDIKISDLILFKNFHKHFRLYKNDNSLYSFNITYLKKDNYYGFELDKNHRYVTGDNFVHHNSNGKSFLVELVKSVLGQYGRKMPLAFLTDSRSKSTGADPALMELMEARLAYYSESEKNEALNTARVKELTSQESMAGRKLYESMKNFRPTCHHMITTNHHFTIKTTDHGIWRRILTYSFKMKFVSDPDPENKYERKENTKFAQEFTYNNEIKKAFLSILVEYYKDLYTNHGGSLKNIDKPSMDKETAIYRNKQDTLNRFIDLICIYSPNSSVKTCVSELVDKYEEYYNNNIDRINIPSKQDILSSILNSKLSKYIEKTDYTNILKNIKLKEEFTDYKLEKDEIYIKDLTTNNKSYFKPYEVNKFNPLNL